VPGWPALREVVGLAGPAAGLQSAPAPLQILAFSVILGLDHVEPVRQNVPAVPLATVMQERPAWLTKRVSIASGLR